MCANQYVDSSQVVVVIPSTTEFDFTLRAPMPEIRWRSSDRQSSETQRGNVSGGRGGERYQSAKPLSTGATAAIGVCVPLAIFALTGIATFFFRRRMKRSRQSAQVELAAAQQSTLPEVYNVQDSANHVEKTGPLLSPCSEMESFAVPIEAAPRYEAEDTSPPTRSG